MTWAPPRRLIGLAFTAQDLAGGLFQPISGTLADRWSRRAMVTVGLSLTACLMVGLSWAWPKSFWLVMAVLMTMGAVNTVSFSRGVRSRSDGRQTGGDGDDAGGCFRTRKQDQELSRRSVGGLMKDLYGTPAAFYLGRWRLDLAR